MDASLTSVNYMYLRGFPPGITSSTQWSNARIDYTACQFTYFISVYDFAFCGTRLIDNSVSSIPVRLSFIEQCMILPPAMFDAVRLLCMVGLFQIIVHIVFQASPYRLHRFNSRSAVLRHSTWQK